jgi:hypothetical protein
MRTFHEFYERRLNEALITPVMIQDTIQQMLPTMKAQEQQVVRNQESWITQRAVQMSQRAGISQKPETLIQMAVGEAIMRAHAQPPDLYAGQPGAGMMGPGDVH